MEYLVIDLETGITEHIGRKGCFLVNPIVAATLKNGSISKSFMTTGADDVMSQVPDSIGVLVGHNIKFDLLYLWGSKRLQNMFVNGLRIWDTQLAHYMLSGQRDKYPALRDIAVTRYGQPERTKHMEEYWKKGIDTKDIPTELVLEDVKYDGIDTEAIMLQQVAEARKMGIYRLIMESMEGLLATTEMEFNGIHVNQVILNVNKRNLESEIVKINAKLQQLAPEVDNFSSPTQISKLFFGGDEKVVTDEPILNELGEPTLTKTGPNRGQVKTKKVTTVVYKAGLNLAPLDAWAQKRAGIYRTDEGVLQTIVSWFDDSQEGIDRGTATENGIRAKNIAQNMLKLRGLNKLVSTYYDGTLKYLHSEDSSVHANYNHCSTDTGRLSCNKPNMQNQIN